jgi:hypothetical protein
MARSRSSGGASWDGAWAAGTGAKHVREAGRATHAREEGGNEHGVEAQVQDAAEPDSELQGARAVSFTWDGCRCGGGADGRPWCFVDSEDGDFGLAGDGSWGFPFLGADAAVVMGGYRCCGGGE